MPMARVSPTELAFAHAVQHLAYAYVTRGIQSTCRCVGQASRVSEELPETARCCSDRVFHNILLTFPGLGQTKVNLPFMLQHRFLARRASFRLRFRPCWYKDFFKGKGVPPTAHPALSRQRLRSGFVFFPRVRSGFVLIVRPILRQRTDAISLNLLTGSLCIQPYIYIYSIYIYYII